ncbi:MAG: hypothetical protein KJ714_01215 [Euryarchaeota archaeon]|nr:hypothetical protein [Euryarchaeota archaeon]
MTNKLITADQQQNYFKYIAEFDEKFKSSKIIEENGAFYEITSSGEKERVLGKLTYSEWLLERINLTLTMIPQGICRYPTK